MNSFFDFFRNKTVNLVALIIISALMVSNQSARVLDLTSVNGYISIGIVIFAVIILWCKKEYLASHVVMLFAAFSGPISNLFRTLLGYNFGNENNPMSHLGPWDWIWLFVAVIVVAYLVLTIIARWKEFSRKYTAPSFKGFIVFGAVLLYCLIFSSVGDWISIIILPLYVLLIKQRTVSLVLLVRSFIGAPITLLNLLINGTTSSYGTIIFWLQYLAMFAIIGFIIYEIVVSITNPERVETKETAESN